MSRSDDRDRSPHDAARIQRGIVRTVRVNTGYNQPAGMRYTALLANRCSAGLDREAVERAVAIARERDDLLAWRDGDDRLRLAEPTADAARAVLRERGETVTVGAARGLIEAEVERDEPNRALIGAANQLVDELREDAEPCTGGSQ